MSKRAASSERRAGMFAQLLILVLSCSLLAARCSLAPRRAMFDLKITNGRIIDGKLKPSSDLDTHTLLYREFPSIGAVVRDLTP